VNQLSRPSVESFRGRLITIPPPVERYHHAEKSAVIVAGLNPRSVH
jgi:hypothetical protein